MRGELAAPVFEAIGPAQSLHAIVGECGGTKFLKF